MANKFVFAPMLLVGAGEMIPTRIERLKKNNYRSYQKQMVPKLDTHNLQKAVTKW